MMKRLSLALSILVLLGIISPVRPALAQPSKTPHEDPTKAAGTFDSAWLLLCYSRIANQAVNSRFRDAQDVLGEMEKASVPDDIRFIIDRYNALNRSLFTTLDTLDSMLETASDLLDSNRINEARQTLDSSENAIQDATFLLQDTETAARSLSDKLGVAEFSPGARLPQAYASLENSTQKLSDLIGKFRNIKEDLDKRYTEMQDLLPTTLSLNISPQPAFIGDRITASGTLTGGGAPLAGKKIVFFMGNVTIAIMATGADGSYVTSITLPYIYNENATMFAVYQPEGNDAGIFLAGKSGPIEIHSYTTSLNINVPPVIYAGMPFLLKGEVISEAGGASRQVNVSLNGRDVAAARVNGSFSFEVTPPVDAASGRQALTVNVATEGRYSGADIKKEVYLSVMELHFQARTTTVAVLPGAIKVSGTLSNELGPLPNVPVVFTLDNTPITLNTAPDGVFSGSVKLHALPTEAPLAGNPFYISTPSRDSLYDLFPVKIHRISIRAAVTGSSAPAPILMKQVVTVNPLTSGLVLFLLAGLGLVYYRKRQIRVTPETALNAPEPAGEPLAVPSAAPLPQPVSGIRGRVLSAYRGVLAAVEKVTGTVIAPGATLREFLQKARLPSPAAAARFAELTAIAESSLYAAADPPDFAAARAEKLAGIIREELRLEYP